MKAIPWTVIGLVILWDLVWFVIMDICKVLL